VQLRRIVVIGTLVAVVIVAAILYRKFAATGGEQRTIAQQTQSETAPGKISRPEGRAPAKEAKKGGNAARGPVPIVSTQATVEDFPIRRRTIGTFETPAAVIIRARVDSQVLEQHVRDGQLVKKGDLLFTLDDRELQATLARDEAQLAKDQAELTRTELDLQRARDLVQRSAAPQTQLETATAGNRAAAATVKADQAQIQADQIRLSYTQISAPMDGRIGTIRVAPGNLVSANDTSGLTTLTQMQPLRVSFTLPGRDLALLRAAFERNPPAPVRVYEPDQSEPLAEGLLDFIDTSVDVSSGTVAARATFTNDGLSLWPGQFVDVEIDLGVRPQTTMVPTVAIQTGQQGSFVFVVKPDDTVELRKVQIFATDHDRTALASGVQDQERVVVEGQLRLVNGARVSETSEWPALGASTQSRTAVPPSP